MTNDVPAMIPASLRRFFSAPLASDGAGNLFFVDISRGTIRKVVIATGEVTTLAGSPEPHRLCTADAPCVPDGTGVDARFGGIWGLASDGAGNLFVGEGYLS
jgi:sugar lactone lactonase YvrE